MSLIQNGSWNHPYGIIADAVFSGAFASLAKIGSSGSFGAAGCAGLMIANARSTSEVASYALPIIMALGILWMELDSTLVTKLGFAGATSLIVGGFGMKISQDARLKAEAIGWGLNIGEVFGVGAFYCFSFPIALAVTPLVSATASSILSYHQRVREQEPLKRVSTK